MPGDRAQGENGNGTRGKEAAFACLLAYHMTVCERTLRTARKPYFVVDLNAGSGYNPHARATGSPLLIARHAAKHPQLAVVGYLIEKNLERFHALLQNLSGPQLPLFPTKQGICRLEPQLIDNAEFLPSLPGRVALQDRAEYAIGMIYSDANGVNRVRGGFPLVEIGMASDALPRFAIVISYAWQNALRVQGYNRTHDNAMTCFSIADIFRHIDRPYWLISESTPHGRVVLCGTSMRFNDRRQAPPYFYDLASPDGQRVLTQAKGSALHASA